jgi:hypothetical protein
MKTLISFFILIDAYLSVKLPAAKSPAEALFVEINSAFP